MKSQQPPDPDASPTSFVLPDSEVQKEIARGADALLPELGEDDEEVEEYELWSLVVGQRIDEDREINANVIPRFEWEGALEKADGNVPDGFVILTTLSGDYVQALAQPEGYVLEYHEIWPKEKTSGFRHYRARKADEDGQPPRDDAAAETWMMNLETVIDCFECFSEYPNETPESMGVEWWDVTESFTPAAASGLKIQEI